MRGFTIAAFLSFAALSWGSAEELWSLRPVEKISQHRSIDAFIQASLQEKGLKPSPEADRRTLIRRATFDLTGLPPAPEDVESFVRDRSPQAYERLIERLLASPHYGEHWSRHWLDVARYSDTKGYVYAREEKMWVHASTYRDWVVRALNTDMPYDRFLLLQIAADQVVPAGSPDLAAMGFLTLGRRFLGVTHDIIDDRIDVVMRGTQALTVSCARCHDHKFDPIPTRDYYALYGVFQSSTESLAPCGTGEPPELAGLIKANRELMAKRRAEVIERTRSQVREHLEAQLELEKYPEETFGQILDAKDLNPFIVRRWQAWLAQRASAQDPVFAPWHAFASSTPDKYSEVWNHLRASSSKVVHHRVMQSLAKAPTTMREVAQAYAEALGSPELKEVLDGIGSPCHVPDEHIANIEMYFPTGVTVELWKAQGDVDRFLIKNRSAPAYATILEDRPLASKPRVFTRGNPLTKGEEVPRQFLSALGKSKPFTKGSGRLELARAIIDPENPLTARVMVNRLWQHHFGRGIVSTPSDFGKQGGMPTHPALLDWLATRLKDSGWSLKAMHRLMMLSQTYRQSSQVPNAVAQQQDPDNRLLWRMNTHRLSFEEARDAWLSASGKINLELGGRPLPLFEGRNTRRTLYSLVDRESLPSVLRTFDFANPDLSIPARTETTVPQQALFGMNHPFVVQQAKALLKRPGMQSGDDADRVNRIYAQLYQRVPTADELRFALDFVTPMEIPAPSVKDMAKDWLYGYGEWDESKGRVKEFKPLPHFTGSAWQGADGWPNDALGWAQLTATGGHPGNSRKQAVVRRWKAPADGSYSVRSTLLHEPAAGDGIRAFVSHGERGLLQSLKLHQGSADLNFDHLTFRAGQTIDFVVDIGDGLNSDQFLWAPRILQAATTGSGGDTENAVWDAQKDFAATPGSQLNVWEQFVQVLMLANEFMFVD